MHQHGAPTAADVEHARCAGCARLIDMEVELATLRALKIVVGVLPHRARVTHRRIEPDPPELVADVIVMANRGRPGA